MRKKNNKSLALIFFLQLNVVLAEDPTSKQFVDQANSESTRLAAIQAEREELSAELAIKEKELRKFSEQKRTALQQIKVVTSELKSFNEKLKTAEVEFNTKQKIASQRISAIYRTAKRGGAVSMNLLLNDSGARNLTYARTVALWDRKIISDLKDLSERLKTAKVEKEKTLAEQRALEEELTAKEREISESLEEKRKIIADLDLSLKENKTVLASLNTKAVVVEEGITDVVKAKQAEKTEQQTSFSGLPKQLPLPVSGKMLSPFGKRTVSGFSDILFQKGIEFAAEENSSINVVADGTVRFSGTMAGYGLLVIVDHGKRNYSLYGRLAVITAKVGDLLKSGESLGRTGNLDASGKNFYFEIRKEGKAIDPAPFFEEL